MQYVLREVRNACFESEDDDDDDDDNNNNNNNNNIYLVQLGCNPAAVVILHVHKT